MILIAKKKKTQRIGFYSEIPKEIIVEGTKFVSFTRHHTKERAEDQIKRFTNMGLLTVIREKKSLRGKVIGYTTYVTKKGKKMIQKPAPAQKGWKARKTKSYLETGKKGRRKGSFPAFYDEQTYIYYPKKKTVREREERKDW